PGELIADRLQPELLDALLVHEAGVQVADLPGLGAGCGVIPAGRLLADRPEILERLVPELEEGAVPAILRGDIRLGQPTAVDMAEEVILGPRLDVEARLLDPRAVAPVRRARARSGHPAGPRHGRHQHRPPCYPEQRPSHALMVLYH